MNDKPRWDRRQFLTRGALAAGAMTVAAPFDALLARGQHQVRRGRGPNPDYGPLLPAIDETTGLPLLHLPEDFRYLSFGWTGEMMNDGIPTPPAHDGMAAFPGGHGRLYLIRNHEVGEGPDAFAPAIAYDDQAGGGTSTVEFDTLRGKYVSSWGSISGTVRNCAGGPTPWGSWLTCEETTIGIGTADLTKNHGYIFEVPLVGPPVTTPYAAMGRFSHEALAVDPATGFVYETEDAGDNSGFYRFSPNAPGALEQGGVLEMLAVVGSPQFDTRINQTGDWLDVEWKLIDDPDPPLSVPGTLSVFRQGFNNGGARFGRLEGAWYGHGRVYFVSTSGGNAGQGQVFEYDPLNERVRLLFESPSSAVLNAPDNLCVSPRGGIVLCEDGSGAEFVHGLTTDGVIFPFARNNVDLRLTPAFGFSGNFTGSEFAGACYSPDGKWLFFNIQSPGITFAVTGPWGSGAL